MRPKQILAADDDSNAIQPIRERLEARGEFNVHVVATAGEVLQWLAASIPDALLLDTTLPDRPAQEVCRTLRTRERTLALPCIMLGEPGAGLRLAEALSFGADDFVAKPVDLQELEARLRALLRRRGAAPASSEVQTFRGAHIEADFQDIFVAVDHVPVTLTRREFLLLRALVEQCNHTLTREALLARVWGSPSLDCRVVDSAMWKLRKKLKAAGDQIQTVVGFGYRFNEPWAGERGTSL